MGKQYLVDLDTILDEEYVKDLIIEEEEIREEFKQLPPHVSDLIGELDKGKLPVVNTRYFREAAIHYQKHGFYCKAPFGSKDYKEYWYREKERCINGYSVGDLWIPGKYYFYLNYFPIMRQPTKEEKELKKYVGVRKILGFPEFWEVQLIWELNKDAAFKRDFGLGNHMTCLKTRGCGFSYLGAKELVYNYNFVPKSVSYAFASDEKYLVGRDGLLNKAWEGLDHLNANTQNFWKRNRQVKNTDLVKKASYIDLKTNSEKGYKSIIAGAVIDDPRKVRGERGILGMVEEAGSMPNLINLLSAMKPLFEEGSEALGQILMYGTGGEEKAVYIEDLEEIFYNPERYNMASFVNKWSEGGGQDTIGFFVPADVATPKFFDEETGKPLVKEARAFWESQYQKVEANNKALVKLKAERPLKPSDIFYGMTSSVFPIKEIKEQRKKIKSDKYQGFIKHGHLIQTGRNVEFIPDKNKYVNFPHKISDDLSGEVTVFETPQRDNSGIVPDGLYTIVHDPYMFDETTESYSLGSTFVYKTSPYGDTGGDIIVAEYTARPGSKDIYNYNLFLLAKYYNAKINFELAGGGQDVVSYAKNKNLLHYLEFEPEILSSKEITTKRNRRYGVNLTADQQKTAILLFAGWLMEVVSVLDSGEEVLNLHRVYSDGLLAEIEKFNQKGNFDRVSAMKILMWIKKEKLLILETNIKKRSNFFNRTDYFGSTVNSSQIVNDVSFWEPNVLNNEL